VARWQVVAPGMIGNGLDFAVVYAALQRLLGGHAARQRVVSRFIRPTAGARILDLGCGPGTLLSYLPEDLTYVGVDSNPGYVSAAERRYGSRARFICSAAADVPTEAVSGEFDLVLAMGLLHHLGDEDAAAVVDLAHRRLAPGGHFVSLDCAFHQGQGWLARRLVAADRGAHIRTPDGYRALVGARFSNFEADLVPDLLRVPYSHFMIRACKGRT
jgi:SAM-dependent methyltransferase